MLEIKIPLSNQRGRIKHITFLHLQFASGSQVLEELHHVIGQRGRSGQMIAFGLESVLIGHPVDGVSLAIFRERVAALRHGAGLIHASADLLLDSALADDDSVLRLVAERVLLPLRVVVLRLFDDEDGAVELGGGKGQEGGQEDHLKQKTRWKCFWMSETERTGRNGGGNATHRFHVDAGGDGSGFTAQ